jgi:carboxyl-terminal processing protease
MKKKTNSEPQTLTAEDKRLVLDRVLAVLSSKFYKPDLLGAAWQEAVAKHRPHIEAAPTPDAFEQAMMTLLHTLDTSHLGFFHGSARRASSRAALSATYLTEQTPYGTRWVFQDVHEGGAAATSGIEPGNILLRVNGKEILPPEHPVFPMDSVSDMVVVGKDRLDRTVSVKVARPKGKKLHFVEPTLVQAKQLSSGVGYLKVAMFPGMIGVEVANAMSQAVAQLSSAKRLIIDLRGNTGGGAGCLRLMSLMTPSKTLVTA